MSCEQGTFKPESNSFWLSLGLTLSLVLILAHSESVWLILALFLGSGSLKRSLAHKVLAQLVTLLPKFIPPWLRHDGKILYLQFHLRLFHILKCTDSFLWSRGTQSISSATKAAAANMARSGCKKFCSKELGGLRDNCFGELLIKWSLQVWRGWGIVRQVITMKWDEHSIQQKKFSALKLKTKQK